MSHPAHIILRGGVGEHIEENEYSIGSVEVRWRTPSGLSHEEVSERVEKILDLEQKIYEVMEG